MLWKHGGFQVHKRRFDSYCPCHMKPEDELDVLRLEIRTLPQRHYNHAARALAAAEKLLEQRNNLIAFSKQLLLEMHLPEKEALAQTYRHMHSGEKAGELGHRTTTGPY